MFVAQLGAYYTDVSWNKRFTFDPCKLLNITASFEYIYTLLEALLDTPHHLWREMTSTAALEVVNSSSFLLKLPLFIWKISVNKWLEVCVLNEEKCCVSLIVLVKFLKLSVLPSLPAQRRVWRWGCPFTTNPFEQFYLLFYRLSLEVHCSFWNDIGNSFRYGI